MLAPTDPIRAVRPARYGGLCSDSGSAMLSAAPTCLQIVAYVKFEPNRLEERAPAEQDEGTPMIRKLSSGEYRLYSRKKDPKTGKRRNLGTFKTRAAAEKHERAVQFFKRQG